MSVACDVFNAKLFRGPSQPRLMWGGNVVGQKFLIDLLAFGTLREEHDLGATYNYLEHWWTWRTV
jgi:hypothetical protein